MQSSVPARKPTVGDWSQVEKQLLVMWRSLKDGTGVVARYLYSRGAAVCTGASWDLPADLSPLLFPWRAFGFRGLHKLHEPQMP